MICYCEWCDEVEVETSGAFCSEHCETAYQESLVLSDDDYDGQPSELDEWLDFDPDC